MRTGLTTSPDARATVPGPSTSPGVRATGIEKGSVDGSVVAVCDPFVHMLPKYLPASHNSRKIAPHSPQRARVGITEWTVVVLHDGTLCDRVSMGTFHGISGIDVGLYRRPAPVKDLTLVYFRNWKGPPRRPLPSSWSFPASPTV